MGDHLLTVHDVPLLVLIARVRCGLESGDAAYLLRFTKRHGAVLRDLVRRSEQPAFLPLLPRFQLEHDVGLVTEYGFDPYPEAVLIAELIAQRHRKRLPPVLVALVLGWRKPEEPGRRGEEPPPSGVVRHGFRFDLWRGRD